MVEIKEKLTASQYAPFLERHYYQGGLRVECVNLGGGRPQWAPPQDAVGFRDEVALSADDIVIEIAKFSNRDGVITWLGAYQHAPDEVYGDRNNHVGMGLWLFNKAPSLPAVIVDGLCKLIELYTKHVSVEARIGARDFLQNFVGSCLTDYTQFPHPLGGLSPANGIALETVSYATDLTGEARDRAVDALISRLLYLPNPRPGATRALILLTSKDSARAALSRGFIGLDDAIDSQDVLGLLPSAFESQRKQLTALQDQLASEAQKCDELDLKIDRLHAELASERRRSEFAEQEAESLRAIAAENDEARRHALMMSSLSATDRRVGELARDMRSMKNDLANLIREEIHRSSDNKLRGMSYSEPNSFSKTVRAKRSQEMIEREPNDKFWLYSALSVALVVVGGLIGFLLIYVI